MKYIIFLLCFRFFLLSTHVSADVPPSFEKAVAPLLARRCLSCHGGTKPRGGLDLSTHKGLLTGGDSGKVVNAGEADKSLLWKRVRTGEMPPKTKLSPVEKALLKKWIDAGARWENGPIDLFRYTTDTRAGYDWWALQPVKRPAVPKVKAGDRILTPIDAYLLQELSSGNLTFSEKAKPRQLIRRLYFDLIGLPPEPEVVQAFEANPSDEAYRKLVDKLLDSPRYGERWARHWLDVVRFGESDGFERNNPRKNFWHYRDWVIRAFNSDMPFDEFARMQIAGDVLTNDYDGAAAVGFLVAGVHNTVVGQSERMKKLARQDELEEITGTVGQTFLGLTVHCARCHDHKFDPIRQKEYYQLTATLAGVNHGERNVAATSDPKRLAEIVQRIKQHRESLEYIVADTRKAILADRKAKKTPVSLPEPLAQWNFDGDCQDKAGQLHGKLNGNARIVDGSLVLDGRSYMSTVPLKTNLAEKTLEAWVTVDDLNQRGGGVMSVQTLNGATFDAIVYGEQQPKRWMAGSDFFRRTRSFQGPEEAEAGKKPVHMAFVYRKDGTITAYRNGQPYGKPYKTGFQTFQANRAQILFGLRHSPPGGNKFFRGKVLQAKLYDRALSPDAVAASAGRPSEYISQEELLNRLKGGKRVQAKILFDELEKLEKQRQQLQDAKQHRVYTNIARNPGPTFVLERGDVMAVGERVSPIGVKALKPVAGVLALPENASDAQRRKKLAEWITHPDNPLFARVIVNRLWHYHFGQGIVQTPSDFGFNGGRPSHPQLLDWLAAELRSRKYSLKAMHRLIVTSAAYQQSSKLNEKALKEDANNRLLWRWVPKRLEAEVIRDATLQVAGQLNRQMGGPGFEDVRTQPNNGTTYYIPVDPVGKSFHRRTIYRFTPRGGRSSLLDTFDCPDACAAAPKRVVTTTPLQALSLFNNTFMLRMSDAMARRIASGRKEVDQQVERAFRLCFGRDPMAKEQRLAEQLVRDHGLSALCRALLNSNEYLIVD